VHLEGGPASWHSVINSGEPAWLRSSQPSAVRPDVAGRKGRAFGRTRSLNWRAPAPGGRLAAGNLPGGVISVIC